MRVAVFFICLFLLLLGGYTYIYTGGAHQHTQHVVKPQQQKFTHTKQQHTTIKEVKAAAEEEYFLMEEVEDEDTHELSARKYKLLTSCYLTISSQARYLSGYPKGTHSFSSPLSYIYIKQGVLRI